MFLGFDLALLSYAVHSILSYGTFGIWGALLTKGGGDVVVPKVTLDNMLELNITKEWQKSALAEKDKIMDGYGYEILDHWITI